MQIVGYINTNKNVKVKIYRTIILPVVVYGCETWLLTLREERRLTYSDILTYSDNIT